MDCSFEEFTDEKGKFKPRMFAKWLMDKKDFLTMDETAQVYVRNSAIYKSRGESVIRQKVENILPESYNSPKKAKEDVLDSIKDSTRIKRKDFKEPPQYINLENGVYDFKNDEFIEEHGEFCFRHQIPVKYDPDAEIDKIKDYFYDIVKDEDVKLLQELIGYCLYRDYPIAKAFMLLAEGENGKTTFLNFLESFLGQDNIANPSIHDLLNKDFAKVDLFGKLANINGDLNPDTLKNTGVFKRLTGGDTIRARRMYQSAFKFKNYAKMIYSANELPNTNDDTEAFFRRWIIIEFPYKFSSEENDGHKDVNPNILDEICTEEEFSGLFNWAVDGLKRVLKRNEFSKTESTKNIKERWLMMSDSLKAFCELYVETDIDCMITKDDFYRVYRNYCYKAQLNFKNRHKIGHQLHDILPVIQEKPVINGSQERVWKGIRFSEDLELEDEDVVWYRDEGGFVVREDAEDFVDDDSKQVGDGKGLRNNLLKTVENEGEVGYDKLVDMFADAFDKDEEFVEGLIGDLKDDGVLFEPRPGFLKKL